MYLTTQQHAFAQTHDIHTCPTCGAGKKKTCTKRGGASTSTAAPDDIAFPDDEQVPDLGPASNELTPIATADVIPSHSEAVPTIPKTPKPKVKAIDIDKLPTQRQLHMARTKMLRVLLPADKEDWAKPILHAFPTFRKLALASRADIGKIKKGKKRVEIDTAMANRLYWCFH